MKPNMVETPIAVDRLATSDEIRAAVLPFPDAIGECRRDIWREIAADVGGYIRTSAVEFEASLLVEELVQERDTWAN
jgi:hypothetical protein